MFNIIPKPESCTIRNSKKVLKGEIDCFVNAELKNSFNFFKNYFEAKSTLKFNECEDKTIAQIIFDIDAALANEEYVLDVNEKIIITASTEIGAFYAVQSLRQLAEIDLKDNANELEVMSAEIKDKPRFEWRGFMLDEARHFFGMDFVKSILDMMALLKMNIFHWHLTDDQGWRIEIKKYPLLATKGSVRSSTALSLKGYEQYKEPREMKPYGEGCYYTQEQIKEIVKYAADLHINVVPEIDMPGHLVSAIACYPELSCSSEVTEVGNRWGVMENIACCGKENVYTLAKDIIDELTNLFPFPYFHIGGDEVPKKNWKKCPNCQKKMKELGLETENELQGYFNNQILMHLNSKGRHMIGWNEILEATKLSDDTIVQWWTNGKKANENEKKWIKKGNKVILSKVEYVYMDHFYDTKPLSKTYAFDLESLNISPEFEKNVLGLEAPQWTEYVRDKAKFDLNTFPRLQAIAEAEWTKKSKKDYQDFLNRLEYHEKYMDKLGIGHAKRSVYEPKGLTKMIRVMQHHKNWVNNPNIELNYNK